MKRAAILITLLCGIINLPGQNFQVTFTGIGESIIVDSVVAMNISTNEAITIPGDQTLTLTKSTGIYDNLQSDLGAVVSPNPFSQNGQLSFNLSQKEKVVISVHNLLGKLICVNQSVLGQGGHTYQLNINDEGIYIIQISTSSHSVSLKTICSVGSGSPNQLLYTGVQANAGSFKGKDVRKGVSGGYSLGYSDGNHIHYHGYSGRFSTVVSDSISNSKEIAFEFHDCTDPDGRTYGTVKIGDQVWMAENLAYLPELLPVSYLYTNYYVYDYRGTDTTAAKSNNNYSKYGVLYNMPAAKDTICPKGWHVPSLVEWNVLIEFVGQNSGNKLKDPQSWENGSSVEQLGLSGFNALAGGNWQFQGSPGGMSGSRFEHLNKAAKFWTSEGASWIIDEISPEAIATDVGFSQYQGLSVRCIEDE